ncbi:MAG TPA: hypothetical protein VFN67_22630, partial [Polyangiales bacterium]|nr:hypothetical protein [Polyangiales bacterium]
MAASRCWLTLVGALAVVACQSESEAKSGKTAQDKRADAHDKDAALAPKPDPVPLRGLTQSGLTAVWGSSAEDVWAVGSEGAILHSDGKNLEIVASTTTRSLHAIAGTGPDDIWAGGEEGTTLHWDGNRFEFVQRWESETFLGINAIAPDNVWIVGVVPTDRMGLVRHWDGETWTGAEVPGSASL